MPAVVTVKVSCGQHVYWPTAEGEIERAKHLGEGEFTEIKNIRWADPPREALGEASKRIMQRRGAEQ